MTHYLKLSDGSIGYDDTGTGSPAVIAAPGMGDLRQSYRHLRPILEERGMRFVSMDLRGLGNSTAAWPSYTEADIAADMLALAAELDAGPVILVGNSMTASSAVIAATDAPEAVAGIVLLGPFARPVPTAAWQKMAFNVMLMPPWGRSLWTSYYRKQLYPGAKPPDHDAHVEMLKRNLAEPGRFSAFRKQTGADHVESGSRLERVQSPSVVVMGTADPDFPDPVVEARELAEALRGDVVLVEGVGHYPQAQTPETVADAISAIIG